LAASALPNDSFAGLPTSQTATAASSSLITKNPAGMSGGQNHQHRATFRTKNVRNEVYGGCTGARNSNERSKGEVAEVIIFHHAQGLTSGIVAFADDLRRAGHIVHTPDVFDGRTFATVDEGVDHAREIGFGEVLERGVRAAEVLPAGLVYAGFSLGAMPAQKLAQTRAGARGALLFQGCVPVSEFSVAWPDDVPVQIHAMDNDPFFVGEDDEEGDIDAARALVEEAKNAELFLYPGDQHLFADNSLPSYDADAAALLTKRVVDFLSGM
jgi:dienelactone hydrolase